MTNLEMWCKAGRQAINHADRRKREQVRALYDSAILTENNALEMGDQLIEKEKEIRKSCDAVTNAILDYYVKVGMKIKHD